MIAPSGRVPRDGRVGRTRSCGTSPFLRGLNEEPPDSNHGTCGGDRRDRGAGIGAAVHRSHRSEDRRQHRSGAAWGRCGAVRTGAAQRHQRRVRRSALPESRPRHLHGDGRSFRASPTTPTTMCRSRPARACRSASRCPWPASNRTVDVTGETPMIDPKKTATTTNVGLRRAAADPVGARPVGRAADGARRHRRPRQRRRRRVGPAVELPGEGRRRPARTPGTSTASRSPTWPRSARRRPTTTSTCSRRCRSRPAAPICRGDRRRRAELRAEERREHAARLDAHLLRERRHAGEQPARRPGGHVSAAPRARATASTSTRTTASSSADRSGRTGSGRGAPTARPTSRCSRSQNDPDQTILENRSFKVTARRLENSARRRSPTSAATS